MSDSQDNEPPRKRSALLSPLGIGAMALLGTGTFAATNGFGLGGRSSCMTTQVATSAAQCQTLGGGAGCLAAFASGAQAVGLSRAGSSGDWAPQPLRAVAGGGYQTMGGSPFAINASCSRSSSSSSSRGSSFFWGGSSSSSSSPSSSSASSSSSSRGGFGATSSSFSSGRS